MDIKIELTKNPKPKPADETKLGFGHIFTDHMFVMDYDAGQGWHDARIVPYGPIELMPSAMVLHYGQEIFEGMKAYRTPSGLNSLACFSSRAVFVEADSALTPNPCMRQTSSV